MQKLIQTLTTTAAGSQWKNAGIRHHHGINVPLFSIHSHQSCGIGEYSDLLPLIEWCSCTGLDVVQVLPLNDPGKDKSPYNALSAFALNPIFLSLAKLPYLEKYPNLQSSLKTLQSNPKPASINYDEVRQNKEAFLRSYWSLAFEQFKNTVDFQEYINNNRWLRPYALFKVLKSLTKDAYWETWPEQWRSPTSDQFEALCKEHENEISYYYLQQYLCHKQLEEVKLFASSKNILMMGDIPILISPDSADVWSNPQIFDLNLRAGAPPDMYNKEGQAWGFPIYNWEQLKTEQYSWWRDRLQYASNYYHLYRLDHVVGFFRIWAIPPGFEPKDGAYIPIDKKDWIPQGRTIMEMMLGSSPMLPIAEDLGTVPPESRVCLEELGICGTKVPRWERYWEEDGSFISIKDYSPISLTTVSTHDSPTLTLWWREYPEEAQLYCEEKGWTYSIEITPEQLTSLLRDSHHSNSLFHVNLLNEYLPLFPDLVSKNADEERINIPGQILERNWTYRFIPSVEDLLANKELQNFIKSLLPSSSTNL